MRFLVFLLYFAVLVAAGAQAGAAPLKAAVFGFEFLDDTMEGERADQKARLALANAELDRLLSDSGVFVPLDLAAQQARIADLAPLYKCNGCESDVARDLGAQVEVVGVVRKTSNLILSLALDVKEVGGQERVLRSGQVDIRGNTDETWLRGVRYLVKNRILDPRLPPLGP